MEVLKPLVKMKESKKHNVRPSLLSCKKAIMELLLISECNACVPGRKMNQYLFVKNLNKVTTALSKEEDDDANNEDNVSDVDGRSNAILQAIVELTQ